MFGRDTNSMGGVWEEQKRAAGIAVLLGWAVWIYHYSLCLHVNTANGSLLHLDDMMPEQPC
jgi:hypothetical protein